MAVSNLDTPNLTPAYGQIIQQLQQRAQMERERASKFDIGTQVVKTVDRELQTGRQRAFEQQKLEKQRAFEKQKTEEERSFETDKALKEFDRKMKSEGKKLVDDEFVSDMVEELNSDIQDPEEQFKPEFFERFKNLYVTEQEMRRHVQGELLARARERKTDPKTGKVTIDPVLGAATRLEPSEAAKTIQQEAAGKFNQSDEITLKDTERGIIYKYNKSSGALTPIIGAKRGGVVKSLDDLEKNDRIEVVRTQQKFKNDVLKPKREAIDAANQVTTALNSKNPILDVGVKVKLAKAFGDTGNIALVEQTQYGSSPEVKAEIDNFLSRKTTGRISEENRKYLLEAASVLAKGNEENFENALTSEIETLKDVYNVDPDFARSYLAGSIGKKLKDTVTEYKSAEEVKQAFKSGKIDRERALRILEKQFGIKRKKGG